MTTESVSATFGDTLSLPTVPETKILLTFEETRCSFCTTLLKVGKGIVIQECLHPFCKSCLVTWIENSQNVNIKCPLDCGSSLTESEIKTLVGDQVFERLSQLSYEQMVRDTPDSFRCQTSNCIGFCIVQDGSKVFLCPVCDKSNCVPCKAIHNGFTCDEYEAERQKCFASRRNNPEQYLRELVEKRSRMSGFDQLIESNTKEVVGAGLESGTTTTYDRIIRTLSQQKILLTTREFECCICFSDVPPGEGVILRECVHLFCKDCLISHVEHNEEPEVRCPHNECKSILSPQEVQALLPPNVLEKVNKRNWSLAESIIGSKFHCLTINCDGFCELEGTVNAFLCPLCLKTNCVKCNAIHENVTCEDFKNRIVQNENDQLSTKAIDNLVATGKAMRCSKCAAPVQKDVGCDSVICTVCRTELCWATKGPRWGPKGTGDISGGCRCRVGGVLCHPSCRNCH